MKQKLLELEQLYHDSRRDETAKYMQQWDELAAITTDTSDPRWKPVLALACVCNGRWLGLRESLRTMLFNYTNDNIPVNIFSQLKLMINGRAYWFKPAVYENNVQRWLLEYVDGDEIVEVTL